MFTRAIVRTPAATFAEGLTAAGLGAPDFEKALVQHEGYVAALRECDLTVTELPADPAFPDSTFVEDTAVLVPGRAIIARPGAASRVREIEAMREALRPFFDESSAIEPPGTLDGGDVCCAGEHVFIGLSARTNEEGARQLAAILAACGLTSSTLDVRAVRGLLHLKSAFAWLGGRTLVASEALRGHPALERWDVSLVARDDEYAANCFLVGERVLVPAGFPRMAALVRSHGLRPLAIDMSEFQKQDGGVSCLSLRF